MPSSRRARPAGRRSPAFSREEEQLRLARTVQDQLLPPPLAALPGIEVAARFLPSHNVGGDFFDYFQLNPRTLVLYIGDVQGKGLEGAMYALLVSGLMRGLPKTGHEPASVLTFLNHRLCLRHLPAKFCALTYAVFDLEQRRLILANAGLPFPWLLRGDTLTRVQVAGIPVGMFPLCDYDQAVVTLQPGDRLLFYTDGVPDSLEILRPRGGAGDRQVTSLLARQGGHSATALADALRGRLKSPAGASTKTARNSRPPKLMDDATFLVVHVR